MKSKKIIVLFTVLSCVSAFFLVSKFDLVNKDGLYFQKDLAALKSQSGGNDAQEWLKARYIDVTTGQAVTIERLAEIDKQIRKISKSKSISFIDQGPDNIGGRTRAVLVNRNNSNEVWAGSVSGGLFYSWNKGLKTGIYYLRRKAKHQAQQFTIEPEQVQGKTEKDEICEMCSA